MTKSNVTKSNQKQKRDNSEYESKYRRAHVIIPQEDMMWAKQQKPSINQLWQDCWLSDPYGSRWMPLTTELIGKTLKQAKAILRKQGLFDFKTEMRILEGKRYYETYVINLHGSRRTKYWSGGVNEDPTSGNANDLQGVDNDPKKGSHSPEVGESVTPGGVILNPTNTSKIQSEKEFQEASVTPQELLSNSSKELLSSSPDAININPAAAAAAGLAEEEFVPGERPQCWIDAGEKLKQFVNARKAERRSRLLGTDIDHS